MGYALPSDINAMIYRKLKNVYVIFNSERFSLDMVIFFFYFIEDEISCNTGKNLCFRKKKS